MSLAQQLETFLRRTPRLGRQVYLARGAVVVGDVTLGDYASVWYNAVLRGDINRIVVGHHTNIQDNAVLHLSDDYGCVVGYHVTVGHSAIVHACTVGDEVLVGMGAVILDGAEIGSQCLIGARALVTQGYENSGGFTGAGRARAGGPRIDARGTRRLEGAGGKVCQKRGLLFAARHQCKPAPVPARRLIATVGEKKINFLRRPGRAGLTIHSPPTPPVRSVRLFAAPRVLPPRARGTG